MPSLSRIQQPAIDSLAQYMGLKNRIINGAMMIDQRNAGASVTPVDGQYTLDRWVTGLTQSSKFSVQQNAGSVTPPTGFMNYLGATSLSAYSIASGDTFFVGSRIEGFNCADLAWGTASAQSVTLSFWVRSSLTGTFGGSLSNSAFNYSFPFTFTISAANTWEQKTVVVSGPTTGTWVTNNGLGIRLHFSLGTGSSLSASAGSWVGSGVFSATGANSVVGTNGATFYITGVQLEKGSTATSFDYRPYGTELALCQRYYYASSNSSIFMAGQAYGPNSVDGLRQAYPLPVPMRAIPTTSISGGNDGGSFSAIEVIAAYATTLNLNLRSTNDSTNVWWANATLIASAEL